MEGWNSPVDDATSVSDFPPAAIAYIQRIEQFGGRAGGHFVGRPDRRQTIFTPINLRCPNWLLRNEPAGDR